MPSHGVVKGGRAGEGRGRVGLVSPGQDALEAGSVAVGGGHVARVHREQRPRRARPRHQGGRTVLQQQLP